MQVEGVIAYKVTSHEFSIEYRGKLPTDGAFFEIHDSPWIALFKDYEPGIMSKCKHFYLSFYDETVEIIAQSLFFKQLEGKPVFDIQNSIFLPADDSS